MAKPPDLDALAKQYLDLWQDQLGGVTENEEAAEIMARTVELMNSGAATFAAMAMAATQARDNRGDNDADAPASRSEWPFEPEPGSGATSAAAASFSSDHDLAEFARRLEQLEKRVAALETGPKKSRRRAAKKTRKS